MKETYPLRWPAHVQRSKSQKSSAFKQTRDSARKNLEEQLRLMAAKDVVLTSDVGPRKIDGTLMERAKIYPRDQGVAVYFTRKGAEHVMACDKYYTIEANVHALALTVEALRGIERWGTSEMRDQAMQGFLALPSPVVLPNWWDVFGVDRRADADVIRAAYGALCKKHHPDLGGDREKFEVVQMAWESAKAERGEA